MSRSVLALGCLASGCLALTACAEQKPSLSGQAGGIGYEIYADPGAGGMSTTTTGDGVSATVGEHAVSVSRGVVTVDGESVPLNGNNMVRIYFGDGTPRVEMETSPDIPPREVSEPEMLGRVSSVVLFPDITAAGDCFGDVGPILDAAAEQLGAAGITVETVQSGTISIDETIPALRLSLNADAITTGDGSKLGCYAAYKVEVFGRTRAEIGGGEVLIVHPQYYSNWGQMVAGEPLDQSFADIVRDRVDEIIALRAERAG